MILTIASTIISLIGGFILGWICNVQVTKKYRKIDNENNMWSNMNQLEVYTGNVMNDFIDLPIEPKRQYESLLKIKVYLQKINFNANEYGYNNAQKQCILQFKDLKNVTVTEISDYCAYYDIKEMFTDSDDILMSNQLMINLLQRGKKIREYADEWTKLYTDMFVVGICIRPKDKKKKNQR